MMTVNQYIEERHPTRWGNSGVAAGYKNLYEGNLRLKELKTIDESIDETFRKTSREKFRNWFGRWNDVWQNVCR